MLPPAGLLPRCVAHTHAQAGGKDTHSFPLVSRSQDCVWNGFNLHRKHLQLTSVAATMRNNNLGEVAGQVPLCTLAFATLCIILQVCALLSNGIFLRSFSVAA